jgi:hypothetical protein
MGITFGLGKKELGLGRNFVSNDNLLKSLSVG